MDEHTGHKYTFQFLSAIYYFLLNNYDGFAVESKQGDDAVFYMKENGKLQETAIAEAKSFTKKYCLLKELFYVNKNTKGAITQLWNRSQNRNGVKCVFFTANQIKEELVENKRIKIPEEKLQIVVTKYKELFEKDFSAMKFGQGFNLKKIIEFAKVIEYEHFSKNRLERVILDHLELKLDTQLKYYRFYSFMHYLNDLYVAGDIISKEYFYKRLGIVNDPSIEYYHNALQEVVTRKLKSEFGLISDRKIRPIELQKAEGKFEVKTIIGSRPHVVNDLLKKCSLEDEIKPLAILGGMGIGKSTFALQIIRDCLRNSKTHPSLPVFIEFRGLELEVQEHNKLEKFSKFIQNYLTIQLEQLCKNDKKINGIQYQFLKDENVMLETIKKLLQTPTIIVLDGMDEFKGDKEAIIEFIHYLTTKRHQVIITGRVHAFENITENESSHFENPQFKPFEFSKTNHKDLFDNSHSRTDNFDSKKSSKNSFLDFFKLEDLTTKHVKWFISSAEKVGNLKPVKYNALKFIAPKTKKFPELNFKNPLVLKAILYSTIGNSGKVTIFKILQSIAKNSFKWYITQTRSFSERLPRDRKYDGVVSENIEILLKFHQELAYEILLKNAKNLRSKTKQMVGNYETQYQDALLEFFEECRNVAFIRETGLEFEIVPDRMFDFFVIGQIKTLFESRKIESATLLLLEIIGNTTKYRNLIDLFVETFKNTLEESKKMHYKVENSLNRINYTKKDNTNEVIVACHQTISDEAGVMNWDESLSLLLATIVMQNNDLKLLNKLGLNWYENIFHTKNKNVFSLELSNLKQKHSDKKITLEKLLPENFPKEGLNSMHLNYVFENMFIRLKNLPGLEDLYLGENQLTELPQQIGKLTKLENLFLQKNKLTKLPQQIGELTKLTDLLLQKNQLIELPQEIGKLTNLTHLHLEDNQLIKLPQQIGKLTKLENLFLQKNKVTKLPQQIGELTKLTDLRLHKNQLIELPQEIGKLTKLEKLFLQKNKLTKLPQQLGELTKLKILRLSKNQITDFPNQIGMLTRLTHLIINENKIKKLPSEIENLKNLTHFSIENNQISKLPNQIKNLTKLKILELSKNQITDFPNQIGMLTGLTHLIINENKIKKLPSEIENLKDLTHFSIENNQISKLPNQIKNLTKLKALNLNKNQLTEFQEEVGKLIKLTDFRLANNQLLKISKEVGKLTKLTHLCLSENQLKNVPQEIGNLAKLTHLCLGRNQLTTVPQELCGLIKLTHLILAENKLNKLPKLIHNLAKLTTLNLRKNQINEVPKNVWVLKELKELDLSENQIREIQEIGNLTKLTQLNIENNQLTKIPREIRNLTKLTNFSVYTNQITEVPREIFGLMKLTGLTLGNNKLTEIPREIGNLTGLTFLCLCQNQLAEVPKEIWGHIELTELCLGYNRLTEIPGEIGNLTKLTVLLILENKLRKFTYQISNLPKLKTLALEGNLFDENKLPRKMQKIIKHSYNKTSKLKYRTPKQGQKFRKTQVSRKK